jgi:hypothetical protein
VAEASVGSDASWRYLIVDGEPAPEIRASLDRMTGEPLSGEQTISLIGQRTLIERAKAAGARGDPTSRMEAIILLDFVAESLIKLAADALSLRWGRDDHVRSMLGALQAELERRNATLEYRSRIEKLREIRNLAQHRLIPPDDDTVAQSAADVTDFAANLTTRVWGVALDDLSQAEAVDDERFRHLLVTTERALGVGDAETAFIALVIAATELQQRIGWRDGRSGGYRGWAEELASVFTRTSDIADRMHTLGAAFEGVVADVEALGSGFSAREYRWFRATIPLAQQMVNGEYAIYFRKPHPSLPDLRRAFQLMLMWIQQTTPLPERSGYGRATVADPNDFGSMRVPVDWPGPDGIEEDRS